MLFTLELQRRLAADASRVRAVSAHPGIATTNPNGIGHLRGHPVVIRPSSASQDPALARRLWARSADLTGVESPALTQRLS